MASSPEQRQAPTTLPVVHVIDDDPAVRDGLVNLVQSMGFRAVAFEAPQHFIEAWQPADSGCVILDIRFPDASGLDFQTQLQALSIPLPVILMTGHADVPSSVRGMKAGAIDFLIKPIDDQLILEAVQEAFRLDESRMTEKAQISSLMQRYQSLTCREKEVLELVARGLMNKQVAGELGLSEITVKVHRGSMMRKMKLRTLPDLVRAAEALSISAPLKEVARSPTDYPPTRIKASASR
nr:response regulator [Bradyrhizobium sp. 48]